MLLAPLASADDHEYYVRPNPHPPTVTPGEQGEDCAAAGGGRPNTLAESTVHLLGQVDPQPLLGGAVTLQPLVPTCVAVGQEVKPPSCTPFGCVGSGCDRVCVCANCFDARTYEQAYVSYNVTSGRFTIEPGPLPPISGDSGGDVEFDCLECPPDWLLDQLLG